MDPVIIRPSPRIRIGERGAPVGSNGGTVSYSDRPPKAQLVLPHPSADVVLHPRP